MSSTQPSFVFFGTPECAVTILEALKREHLVTTLIVTAPDKPKGRGLKLTPPPVKLWALHHNIPVLQPEKLKDSSFSFNLQPTTYNLQQWDVFVVAAYGKLIPQNIIDLPRHGVLNVHPSLLPKYRGPSPIETQILHDDRETGVTIMHIDEHMDHGPLLAQTQVTIDPDDWPLSARELGDILWDEGGTLLAYILPRWLHGEVNAIPQVHEHATYSKLIKKEDAEIDLSADGDLDEAEKRRRAYTNFLKIRAYEVWPVAYFFAKRGGTQIRVKITDADYQNGKLIINGVIPEGKKEMKYTDFVRTL